MRRPYNPTDSIMQLAADWIEAQATRDVLLLDLGGTALGPLLTELAQEASTGDYTLRSRTGSPIEVFARGATLEDCLHTYYQRCEAWKAQPPRVPN